jgi:agmatine/peptidylarginine deiminase
MLPEWSEQKGTILIFPKEDSDWNCCYDEVVRSFINFLNEIRKRQKLYLITHNIEYSKYRIGDDHNIEFFEIETNDTWGRDSLGVDSGTAIIDFQFDGWGGKFDASLDNQITENLKAKDFYSQNITTSNLTIEGGAIETDGEVLLLTDSAVAERNSEVPKEELQKELLNLLNLKRAVWLKDSYLQGDDTDGHIDMLVRFADKEKILYYQKSGLEKELKEAFPDRELIPVPTPDKREFNGEVLPLTYLNFIFVNGAVLLPIYGVKQDSEAIELFQKTFLDRDIIPIDSSIFIRQGGSLHCLSMQVYK